MAGELQMLFDSQGCSGLTHDGSDQLRALAASGALIRMVEDRQWELIRDAREYGATWDDVASALGTARGTVYARYHQAIEAQRMSHVDGFDYERAKQAGVPDSD